MKYINKLGFKKVAISGGNILIKVTVLFAIGASRLKNIKYFKNEKEALKWLKE